MVFGTGEGVAPFLPSSSAAVERRASGLPPIMVDQLITYKHKHEGGAKINTNVSYFETKKK